MRLHIQRRIVAALTVNPLDRDKPSVRPKWVCEVCEKQCTRQVIVDGFRIRILCANCEEAQQSR